MPGLTRHLNKKGSLSHTCVYWALPRPAATTGYYARLSRSVSASA